MYVCIYLFLKIFIYSFDRERETASERGNTSRGSRRGRSRLPVEEPDVGLDPIMLGSCPEPKADAQRLSHPDVPECHFFFFFFKDFICSFDRERERERENTKRGNCRGRSRHPADQGA